ncbi:hypothetical protein [Salipaludibacillus daqingensis]|uniref:hypothetical protein n=1 Tax=Salipaludibacillus daqingensis TaxID=3041001 RepID=UPI002476CB72|nr:hypothetical protein [Salipaludibacillus daqingensis]
MKIDMESLSNQLPDFDDHETARAWFKNKFDDRFSLKNSENDNGKKVHYYHIIKNPETYKLYMESFSKPVKHEITEMETLESYSTVEITEDGDISLTL